jgi:hypothetical protein
MATAAAKAVGGKVASGVRTAVFVDGASRRPQRGRSFVPRRLIWPAATPPVMLESGEKRGSLAQFFVLTRCGGRPQWGAAPQLLERLQSSSVFGAVHSHRHPDPVPALWYDVRQPAGARPRPHGAEGLVQPHLRGPQRRTTNADEQRRRADQWLARDVRQCCDGPRLLQLTPDALRTIPTGAHLPQAC